MQKTIKLDSKHSIRLSNNVGWMMEYRDQMGHDIVPDLIPLLNGAIDIAVEVSKASKTAGTSPMEILAAIGTDKLQDALFDMSGLEAVDLINITWAMAKAADEDLPEPREWVREFETFPLDIIVPVVVELLFSCMVSSKNLKRLRSSLQDVKPSPSTAS